MRKLRPLPLDEIKNGQSPNGKLLNACTIAGHAHKTCSSFLAAFNAPSKGQEKKRGSRSDVQQDLLRAMLVFACSGLDSAIKQAIKDALPIVIEKDEGAKAKCAAKLGKLAQEDKKNLLIDALMNENPKGYMVAHVIGTLTEGSLQSTEEIHMVSSFFNIDSKAIFKDKGEQDKTRSIFTARNQIIHEMDIHLEQRNRSRRQRNQDDMIEHTNAIFRILGNFLLQVDKKLSAK